MQTTREIQMAALIKQANKRVRNGQEAKDKKERTHGEREREFRKRKKRQVMSASNGTKAGYT